jgi:hypothetical protein
MRKFFFSLFIGLVLCTAAYSQDTKPRTSSGDRALLFSINGLGTFGIGGSYAGTLPVTTIGIDTVFAAFGLRPSLPLLGFGMKFYLSDNLALRVALGGGSTTSFTPRAGDTTGATDDVTDLAVGLAPGLEFHLVNAGPVTVYTGAVVNYGMTLHADGDASNVNENHTQRTYSTFGGSAIFGAEYFPWSSVSLGAEYQLGVSHTSSSTENRGKTTDGRSYTDIGISSIAVSLGVYF